MDKIYKVVSKLFHQEYHKLNGEYIDEGTVEEKYKPTVYFDSKEKALFECERILDTYLASSIVSVYIREKDKSEIKLSCISSLKDRNYCTITKAYDNLIIKISECAMN